MNFSLYSFLLSVLLSTDICLLFSGEMDSTFASFSSYFLCLIPSLTIFLCTTSRKESIIFSSDDLELTDTTSFATMESGMSLKEESLLGWLESCSNFMTLASSSAFLASYLTFTTSCLAFLATVSILAFSNSSILLLSLALSFVVSSLASLYFSWP